MPPEIVISVISFMGTLAGALIGVLTANKLTNYRIEQLEKRVEKHNNVIERMALAEASIKSAHHRLDEMREELEKA